MKDLKPNFNHPDFFTIFYSFSELIVYNKLLEYADNKIKFIHNEKSRKDLCSLLDMSEINFKILLRALTKNGVLKKGIRGTYYFRKDLMQ